MDCLEQSPGSQHVYPDGAPTMTPAKLVTSILLCHMMLTSCSHGGGGAAASPDNGPPDNEVRLHLQILEPANDQTFARGDSVHVAFSFSGTQSGATTAVTFTADQDADLSTTFDQSALGMVHVNGANDNQTVILTLPIDMKLGAYSLCGALGDGVRNPVFARANGRLLVAAAPTLQIHEPAGDTTISRGGRLGITFTAVGQGATATVRFVADADGDPATGTDQHELAVADSRPTAVLQTLMVDLTGVPPGTYRILGLANDGAHPVVTAAASGLVHLVEVAFATQEGGANFEEGRAIATFPDASAVVTGRFSGSALFGEWPLLVSLNSAGDDDIFLSRYHPDGSLAWAKRMGSSSSGDWGNAIATFADGSCVVCGYFHGQAAFDEGPLSNGLISAGLNDAFLARYNADGSLAWARRAGGIFNDQAYGVATFPDGSCVVTGSFAAQATFGEGIASTTLTATGSLLSADVFVARYDRDGTLLWARQCGGAAGDDSGRSIGAGPDGACVVTGSFLGTASFGPVGNQVVLHSLGGLDVFVASYRADGSLGWAHRAGGAADDEARGIAVFPDGSSVVTGSCVGVSTFGEWANPTTQNAIGARDLFVARYLPDGALAWARRAGGVGNDEGTGIAARADGRCLVTGYFHDLASFGEGPSLTNLIAAGWQDVFVACYEPDGSVAWAQPAGGPSYDQANGIACYLDGSFAVTGVFLGNATFGVGNAGVTLLTAGWGDVFVARFNADGGF